MASKLGIKMKVDLPVIFIILTILFHSVAAFAYGSGRQPKQIETIYKHFLILFH